MPSTRTPWVAALVLISSGTAAAQVAPVNGIRAAELRRHAIVGASVVTAPGERLEQATIVISDGTIEAVGSDVEAPPDARVASPEYPLLSRKSPSATSENSTSD